MNWAQLRGMIWLRWRLTCNQWRRHGQLNAILTLIAVIFALFLATAGGVAGVAGGAFGLSHAKPAASLLVWDALVMLFLIFWVAGIVADLQRSEILDLSRFLFLPVSLRDVFLLNYLSSHFSLSLAMFVPAMLGLAVGLVAGSGAAMLLLFPLVFGFFFMITAWTYCLRGWLAALMINKRRRRAIIMGVTIVLILLAQLPNLLTNVWVHGGRAAKPAMPEQTQDARKQEIEEGMRTLAIAERVHQYVPICWLSYGAESLAAENEWPAVWGALGMFAIGGWGLTHAYRLTLRFYRGGKAKKVAPAPAALKAASSGKAILVERRVPMVPEEAGAMAVAGLRSLLRAPEVKMALVTNVLIFIVLGASMVARGRISLPAGVKPLVAGAAAAVTLLGLSQLMFNHFGFDRGGFRALVLLPTPRRHILMGKNLALLPLAVVAFVIYLALAVALAHLRAWDIAAATVEFVAAYLVMSVLGNLASILVPYRIAAGSLKPTKTNFSTSVLIFVSHLVFPVVLAPIFLPAAIGALCSRVEWFSAEPVTLACAVALAALSVVLYWLTLEPLAGLLQRREQTILEVVTREVE